MEEHQEGWHLKYMMYEKQLRELLFVQPGKEKAAGNLTATLSYLKGGS